MRQGDVARVNRAPGGADCDNEPPGGVDRLEAPLDFLALSKENVNGFPQAGRRFKPASPDFGEARPCGPKLQRLAKAIG